jgi:hypothetical protein
MNKTHLFHIKSITRGSPYPQEQRNLLTHKVGDIIMAIKWIKYIWGMNTCSNPQQSIGNTTRLEWVMVLMHRFVMEMMPKPPRSE